jgi:hypothetical protein
MSKQDLAQSVAFLVYGSAPSWRVTRLLRRSYRSLARQHAFLLRRIGRNRPVLQ